MLQIRALQTRGPDSPLRREKAEKESQDFSKTLLKYWQKPIEKSTITEIVTRFNLLYNNMQAQRSY